jgi:hypothetical protein
VRDAKDVVGFPARDVDGTIGTRADAARQEEELRADAIDPEDHLDDGVLAGCASLRGGR